MDNTIPFESEENPMILTIYKKALAVLLKKPLVLWGISLLQLFLCGAAWGLFGIIPGVALCICWLLTTSMTLIYLYGYRGREVRTLQLFDCFRDGATIKRVLAGMGWMTLWITLWGLIPVVGPIFAVIRLYRYRLTPYILMQEPEVKPTEAIKLSQARTQGWKGRMFGADILVYVIVWALMLILGGLARIPYIGVLFGIIDFLFSLCCAVLLPLFLGLVKAAFYEEIKAAANASVACPACGNYVHIRSAYCQHCGAPMKAPANQAAAPAAAEAPAPAPAAETQTAELPVDHDPAAPEAPVSGETAAAETELPVPEAPAEEE